MTSLFDGELHVHYGQFYVESRVEDFFDSLTDSRGGQVNGLCGAAVPGMLFLTTGLHTGNVAVAVEVFEAAPPVGVGWEEVVEVSFAPAGESVRLVQWAGEAAWPLALAPVDYRVRYCATGMDRGRAADTRMDGEPLLDRYLLQFWPWPAGGDVVVRQTSEIAAYWHDHARTLPPPPSPEERAEAKRRERLARERAHREAVRAAELRRWDGHPPSERARHVNGAVVLARIDRALLDAIEHLDDATLRALGAWAARQACDEASLSGLDWVAAALDALERREKPVGDLNAAFERMRTDGRVPSTTVPSYDGRHDRVSQQHAALPALWAAGKDDPFTAGLEALFHAMVAFGDRHARLLAAARQAFPALARKTDRS